MKIKSLSELRLGLRLRNSSENFFLTLALTCFSLMILHFAFLILNSYAESLSDIKIERLYEPTKEKWGRDPFVRPINKDSREKPEKEELPIDLKVDGIIYDGKKALAIINGGFYRKNEKVDDFLIVGIDKDRVTLEKNGKKYYLGMEKFALEGLPRGRKK